MTEVRYTVESQRMDAPDDAWRVELHAHLADDPGFEGTEPGTIMRLDDRVPGSPAPREITWVGSLKWAPLTGEIKNVYVAPWWRRQGIAFGLLRACHDFSKAVGFHELQVTGPRTALGHVWLSSLRCHEVLVRGADRLPPLWLAPTTPAEAVLGLDFRLLIPDDPGVLTARVMAARPSGVTSEEIDDLMDVACGPAQGVRLHQLRT